MGGVAPKCNGAALALSSPSMPGLWCQRRSVVLWHHKPGMLGLESASAAPLHFGATPPTRLPHVMFQTRPSTRITVRMRNELATYNERLAGRPGNEAMLFVCFCVQV